MATTAQIYRDILSSVTLLASAIVRETKPSADLISQRRAYKEYGQPFIMRGEEGGMLRPIRTGTAKNSTIKYSRTEILAFMEAEAIKRNEALTLINN